MIKCELNTKTGREQVCIDGKLPHILTELEYLLRGFREVMGNNHMPEEVQDELLETAFENAKLSQEDSILKTMEKIELPDSFKKFVKDLLDKDEE
nr:MAG TPA: hypothetical protein [Caudoviricetes sp.]